MELLIYLSRVRVPEGALKSSGFADRELRGWGFYFVWIYEDLKGFVLFEQNRRGSGCLEGVRFFI